MIIHTRTQIKVQYFKQFCDSIQKVYADDCVEILDYFEITTSVVFGEMHRADPHCFYWTFGKCFIGRNTSFLEQIIV